MVVKEYSDPYAFAAEHAQRWHESWISDGGKLNLERFEQNGGLERLLCLAMVNSDDQVQLTAFVDPEDQIVFSRGSKEAVDPREKTI